MKPAALVLVGLSLFAVPPFALPQAAESLEQYAKQLRENPKSSLAHYRVGEHYFLNKDYQVAVNEMRAALLGDQEPSWTKVWSHITIGIIFDLTDQRERAILQYKEAERTNDNTRDAQKEVAKYLASPYSETN